MTYEEYLFGRAKARGEKSALTEAKDALERLALEFKQGTNVQVDIFCYVIQKR